MNEPHLETAKPPPSQRRLAANRANARKSTGPRTLEGKTNSSRNAIKFGFYSQGPVLPTEDADAFENLRNQIWGQLRPQNELEALCVRELIDTHWRLQRLAQAESEVLARRLVSLSGDASGPGFAFLNDSPGQNPFATLSRAEAMLTRRLHWAMEHLRKLREKGWPESHSGTPSKGARLEGLERQEEPLRLARVEGAEPQAPAEADRPAPAGALRGAPAVPPTPDTQQARQHKSLPGIIIPDPKTKSV